jgi:outer membrane protein
MPRLAVLLAVLLAAPAAAQPGADTLRLDVTSAVRLALDGSPEVAIEQAGVDFAAARARQARAARYLTTFNLTTAHAVAPALNVPEDTPYGRDALYLDPRLREDWSSPRPYNQFEVELLQPIYTWGELGGQIRAAEAAVEVERAGTQARAAEVALRTGELYYGVLATEALGRLLTEAGDALDTVHGELRRLLDEGDPDVNDADLFQLRLFEQEYRRQTVEVTQRRALATSALARQLLRPGTPVEGELLEPVPFAVVPLEAVQAVAMRHRPELRQAGAGVAARSALVDVARSHYYPKLFAGGSFSGRYASGRERQRNPYITDPYLGGGVRAGVGIRQDLAFAQTRARVQQAEAQLNEVRFQQEAAGHLVLFEVEEAYRNLAIAAAALEARTEAAQIAGEWLRTEQINFDLALGSPRDLIAAARADLEARAGRIDAVRAYNVAVLRLLDAAGVLPARALAGTLFEPLAFD